MKKYIIIFALVLFTGISIAQSTDAVYKKIKEEYTLQNNGHIEYRCHKELKLYTHYSFNRMFGETFIVYNPDFQKLIIHKSYTIKADGSKVETPKNAFNEVLPHAAANYPAYNQMREMVVTHTALEIGATIVLDYSIISKPEYMREMTGTEVFAKRVPVEQYEFILKVPARRNLKFSTLNSKVKPQELINEKYRSYQWNFSNLKAQSYEQASPPSYETAPTIIFSTSNDLKAELQYIFKSKQKPTAENSEMKELLLKTQKQTFSQLEMALKLQEYVVNNMDTKHIPLSWHNYQLQSPVQVWQSNVGSQLEKTLLLEHLFQMAGFQTELTAFYPTQLWKAPTHSIQNIHGFGVLVHFKGGDNIILSASELNKKSLELNEPNQVLLNIENANMISPISLLSHPAIHLNAQLTIDPGNQIFGQVDLSLDAASFDYLTLIQDTHKITTYFSSPLPFEEKAQIQTEIKNQLSAKFIIPIKGEDHLGQQKNYFFWKVPHMTNGIASAHFKQLTSERDFPLVVPAIEEEYLYKITLPKSVNWVGNDVHIAHQYDFGEILLDVKLKDGQVVVHKYIRIKPDVVHVQAAESMMTVESIDYQLNKRSLNMDEYHAFKEMMTAWDAEAVNQLIFKR